MERRKRRKPKVTVCRLMYDGSQKQDNRRRIRWTKGRKMTVSFKRNWGNKEQFVRKSKKGCVQTGDFSRSQRTLKMFQSAPPIRPLSAFGAFIPSRWNLLPSRFSIFLSFSAFCLHHSLLLHFPFQLLLTIFHTSQFLCCLFAHLCPSLHCFCSVCAGYSIHRSCCLFAHNLLSPLLLSFYVRALILTLVHTRGMLLMLVTPPTNNFPFLLTNSLPPLPPANISMCLQRQASDGPFIYPERADGRTERSSNEERCCIYDTNSPAGHFLTEMTVNEIRAVCAPLW